MFVYLVYVRIYPIYLRFSTISSSYPGVCVGGDGGMSVCEGASVRIYP